MQEDRILTPKQEVRRYLKTGEHDMFYRPWSGPDFFTKARDADRKMRDALIAEVAKRAKGRPLPPLPADFDAGQFCLNKVGPMVRGLFPAKEQQTILDLFAKALVFVTHENIEQVLNGDHWLETAWSIGNLYLGSLDLPGLDGKPVPFVGFSLETTFFVSMTYFQEDNPFADYVVHEAAHVFHNWKRKLMGLPHTRKREFLLPIEFRKREVFAYAYEAYSRILEQAKNPADRRRMYADYADKWLPSIRKTDQAELVDILAEAVSSRNGWKRILQRCSPPKQTRNSR